ncbi:MAG: hypothetical protein PHY56_00100 [Candidatus Omnitrophica bacterium]|nr:hypothetical protein [Candidatus Omnitrophota bacterium]
MSKLLFQDLSNGIGKVVGVLLRSDAVKATKYVTRDYTIKVKRKCFKGRVYHRGPLELHVTVGRPNYAERKFIKDCIKAGESFPVKKIQLKFNK